MLLGRCWWLYQSTNPATHRHASSLLRKGRWRLSGRCLTVPNHHSEKGLSLLTRGRENDRRTPSSSNRVSRVATHISLPLSAWRINGCPSALTDLLPWTGSAHQISGDLGCFPFSHTPRTLLTRWQRRKVRLVAGEQDSLVLFIGKAVRHQVGTALTAIPYIPITREMAPPALQSGLPVLFPVGLDLF